MEKIANIGAEIQNTQKYNPECEMFTLGKVWELKCFQFGDQGGLVNYFARYFESQEEAYRWFHSLHIEYPDRDYTIDKIRQLTVMISKQKTFYIVEKGPLAMTTSN